MSYRGRSFYPPEGHDWVPTEGIRRAAAHNLAIEEELYVHSIAEVGARGVLIVA